MFLASHGSQSALLNNASSESSEASNCAEGNNCLAIISTDLDVFARVKKQWGNEPDYAELFEVMCDKVIFISFALDNQLHFLVGWRKGGWGV